jgi:hypothetical protein
MNQLVFIAIIYGKPNDVYHPQNNHNHKIRNSFYNPSPVMIDLWHWLKTTINIIILK